MKHRSVPAFFVLVFGLSLPFWLLAATAELQLMPGLQVSALAAFCPVVAASILVHRESGPEALTHLLRRSFDFKRITEKRWYVPILLTMPAVSVLVFALMSWMSMPLPAPQFLVLPPLLMFLAFFIGALGEELGWSGYSLDPLQGRWNAQASFILGVVGIVWHLVQLLLIHRPLTWIAWWCLYAISARILIVWLYNNTGKSVFAAALFHTMLNFSFMLFPVDGSHFDMRLGGLVTAFAAAVVTLVWGPSTLARHQKT